MALFQKKKERAVAFVDFEYMQISFRKKFFLNPPLKEWYADISERFTIDDVFFFADFSNRAMKYNISQIRSITNNVIDTQNTSLRRKKDFTDFFILDAIYRTAFDKNSAKNIILFSGDGHFSAAVRFLREKCAKRVIVYGLENTVSGQLKSCATELISFPSYAVLKRLYYPVVAKTMQEQLAQTNNFLTFMNVLKTACSQTNVNQTYLYDAMRQMMDEGYISEGEQWINSRKRIRVLSPDFDKMKADGIL